MTLSSNDTPLGGGCCSSAVQSRGRVDLRAGALASASHAVSLARILINTHAWNALGRTAFITIYTDFWQDANCKLHVRIKPPLRNTKEPGKRDSFINYIDVASLCS